MQEPSISPDEGERLLALCLLGILDSEPEEAFDRITRRAAAALHAPVALVSLVDESRQWFKSRYGLDPAQTPRAISFCGHVVFDRRTLVVNDATVDPRFAGNPLVAGAPHVRAYMGAPLFTLTGQPVGTLCVIDTRPRNFQAQDVAVLTDFAEMVREIIQTRERQVISSAALEIAVDREQLYRDTFELGAMGIAHKSMSGYVIRSNPRMGELLGYASKDLVGRSFVDLTHADDVARNWELFLQMVSGERDRYRMAKRFRHKDGHYIWANISVALKRSRCGKPEYAVAMVEDISDLKSPAIQSQETRG